MKKIAYLISILVLSTTFAFAQGKSNQHRQSENRSKAVQSSTDSLKNQDRPVTDTQKSNSEGHAYGKHKGDQSGRDFGKARADAAQMQQKIEDANEKIQASEEKLKSSGEKIKAAKDKLEQSRKKGQLSTEEFEAKSKKIREIEEQLKNARDKKDKALKDLETIKTKTETEQQL